MLWIRAHSYSFKVVNIDKQIQLTLGTYPVLYDSVTAKKYVGFESIYTWTTLNKSIEAPSANTLALLANFKESFIPAFMHSLWLDDSNKEKSRSICNTLIGLPTSSFFIYSKQNYARTWFNVAATKITFQQISQQENRMYEKAEQCLDLIEKELVQNNDHYVFGET
ncbi:unnamed protein product, partial [Didymodactylos carnosus]